MYDGEVTISNLKKRFQRGLSSPRFSERGLTMIELLIVIAIIAVLLILLLLALRNQMSRSRDARRKGDLEKIKIAFEEYYNDNNCYPPPDILDNCGGNGLQPYLDKIPCDPFTKQSYIYLPEGNICSGYRVFADLEGEGLCAGGCGYGADYNYGISVGVPLIIPNGTGGNQPNTYACAPSDDGSIRCNLYEDPASWGCPMSWYEDNCGGQCGNPENHCDG